MNVQSSATIRQQLQRGFGMRPFLWLALGVLMCLDSAACGGRESPQVLPSAHAHNDYWHPRPLVDALAHGFCSVEADVFLVDGELLVGHARDELRPKRTLAALYLEPLRRRVRENAGSVYGEGTRFTLLVDVKSDAGVTYAALSALLARYADVVSSVAEGEYRPGAIDVIVSGNRATEAMAAEKLRYAAADGRLLDLTSKPPTDLIPLISENWFSHFTWNGRGEFPIVEQDKLHELVVRAHEQGRRVRFWATPETSACWTALLDGGVDLIGADDLDALEQFLKERRVR